MNSMHRKIILVLNLSTLFTFGLLVQWWLSTGMSESVWTWINDRIEGGQNPGLASDVELLIVLAGALLISASGAMLIRQLLSRIRKKAGDGIR